MQEYRYRPHIHGEGAQPQQMGRNSGQFAANDADILAARRQLLIDPHQFLDGQGVGDVVGQGSNVIQPIRVRDELGIGHVLGDLFIAAMEIPDIGSGFGNDFAVQFQNNAEHTVGGRVRGAHVEDHLLAMQFLDLLRRRQPGSPGRCIFKSNLFSHSLPQATAAGSDSGQANPIRVRPVLRALVRTPGHGLL
jgi:hypothetical protein